MTIFPVAGKKVEKFGKIFYFFNKTGVYMSSLMLYNTSKSEQMFGFYHKNLTGWTCKKGKAWHNKRATGKSCHIRGTKASYACEGKCRMHNCGKIYNKWSRSNAPCGVQGQSPAYKPHKSKTQFCAFTPLAFSRLRVVSPTISKLCLRSYAFGVIALRKSCKKL